MAKQAVLVPMAVQAFVVSENFGLSKYRFAPLLQPDYSNLRAQGLLAYDVMDQLDLSPVRLMATNNTRFMDITAQAVRKERCGVYLSWTLPRVYRQGITATEKAQADQAKVQMQAGYTSRLEEAAPPNEIKFRNVPNRYLIFRLARPRNSSAPSSEIFVLESDRIRNINDADLDDIDVENLTAPFIDPLLTARQQQEIFLGWKGVLQNYRPDSNARARVPFTVVESANELFADFQPHNNSIFSVYDDLGYGTDKQIAEADLNYFVVGFHNKTADDPFIILDSVPEQDKPTYNNLLKACVMSLDPASTQTGVDRSQFLDAKADTSTITICHGTLRNIPFHRTMLDLQANAPAVKLQDLIKKNHPVAVGTNTLDALFAYLRVQYASNEGAQTEVDQALRKIVPLILRGDDIDAQQKAEAEIATNDWIPISAGSVWTVASPGGSTPSQTKLTSPGPQDQATIMKLNGIEAHVSCLDRERNSIYQRLFLRWWNAMEVEGTPNAESVQKSLKAAIAPMVQRLQDLDQAMVATVASRDETHSKISKDLRLEAIAAVPFGTHQDPTILFAGVPSGWPNDFINRVKVRLSSQLPTTPDIDPVSRVLNISGWSSLLSQHFATAAPFVRQLLPDALGTMTALSEKPPASAYSVSESFDGKQGWFPLFMEWEVEYHHIKFEHWRFQRGPNGKWCYKLRTDKPLVEIPQASDCRSFSGRTLITPQASSALKSRLKQLFEQAKSSNHNLNEDALIEKLSTVDYFSAPLTGMRQHLLTLIQATHVRPNTTDSVALRTLGLSSEVLKKLIQFSDSVPYGKLAQIRGEVITNKPFKPAMHGQFVFTKLHIVDKFGQIVTCVEPATSTTPRSALYPCVSEHFFCDRIPKGVKADSSAPWPNTAYQADSNPGLCQFFQVPPRINQDARLNVHFLAEDGAGIFQPVSPWQNPVWAWIIVNNLDKSLQVFDAEGKFVQEIGLLLDDKVTTIISPSNSTQAAKVTNRISTLIRNLKSFPYGLGVFTMLEEAYQATSSSTAEHPDFLPAAFGKAFCLADFGCSLELAAPPMENESLQFPGPPELDLTKYKFPIGLGDPDAGFDGLAAYYDPNVDTDMTSICSAFGDERDPATDAPGHYANPILRSLPTKLELSPFYVSPTDTEYTASQQAKLQRRTAFLDPMRPLHLYTGDLMPVKEVILPPWAIGNAMREMHVFFAAGPLLVRELPPVDDIRIQPVPQTPKSSIQMPVTGLDAWSWLQARRDSGVSGQDVRWMNYTVQPLDGNLDLTGDARKAQFVEGFFLMTKSLQEVAAGGNTK